MGQDAQQQFVSVPVPSQYVTQVYAYLAELTGVTATTPTVSTFPPVNSVTDAAADLPEGDALPVVEWTVEDFRRLAIEPLGSVQTVVRVLDFLAEQPETRVSYTSIANHLGVEKKSLQGNLSAFTRAVRKHYKRRNWPMTWVEALTSEPGLKSEFFYTMNASVAERWIRARAAQG
ncbi:hypothetical protein [Streptomyces gilvus]|uniref:hypothetical protein n=1 Tax=Streptomyces gilvus TaxID=2920937 RepID=UPI001F0EB962|nr:hypothetical protein [Streptomyces sp. CME 23]MCH5674715.1 hypothetical protein [Streptomyces sp. CME 23]